MKIGGRVKNGPRKESSKPGVILNHRENYRNNFTLSLPQRMEADMSVKGNRSDEN